MVAAHRATAPLGVAAGVVLAVVFGLLVMVKITCGIGLLKLKPYGRTLEMIMSCLGLIVLPIGTIIGVLVLIYLNKPGLKILFAARTAETLTPEERTQVADAMKPQAAIVILIALLVVAVPVVLSILAAIAVPSLLRARMVSNETSAPGTLR